MQGTGTVPIASTHVLTVIGISSFDIYIWLAYTVLKKLKYLQKQEYFSLELCYNLDSANFWYGTPFVATCNVLSRQYVDAFTAT